LKSLFALLVLAALLMAGPLVMARTWKVEQDGTGDWVTIQEAFDAAASGDTITIGAGRYSDFQPTPNSTTAIGYINSPMDLTIIGAGNEDVILGSEVFETDGIVLSFSSQSSIAVSGVQFARTQEGIRSYGSLQLSDCIFEECWVGVGMLSGEAVVADCAFAAPQPPPAQGTVMSFYVNSVSSILVERCTFVDLQLYLDGVPEGVVRDCIFNHPTTDLISLNFINSSGVCEGNITDSWVNVRGESEVTFRGNEFLTGLSSQNLRVSAVGATVEVFDNVFHGATYSSIYLLSEATLVGSGNHILNFGSGSHSVRLNGYDDEYGQLVDLRDNYWGTEDEAKIDAWIYDSNDEVGIVTEVWYKPFSSVPLENSTKASLGYFKALFR